MRPWPLLLLALVGCHGTVLSQVETGYAIAPLPDPVEHSGVLVGHIGGSSTPGLGIGLTGRARAFSDGWAFPEVGPHAFVMADNDANVGVYVRAGTLVGLGGYQGDITPLFTAQISPGLLLYPSPDDPLAITISLTAELSGSPVLGYGRFWAGLNIGFAIGGVEEQRLNLACWASEHRVEVFMLRLTLLLLPLSACHGTLLAQAETGVAVAPLSDPVDSAGSFAVHLGGSDTENVGVGFTARGRATSVGTAVEQGPHVFVMVDDEETFGGYVRATALFGFGDVDEDTLPLFSVQLSPGLIYHPNDGEPFGITLGLHAELSGSPIKRYGRFWVGINLGVAFSRIW